MTKFCYNWVSEQGWYVGVYIVFSCSSYTKADNCFPELLNQHHVMYKWGVISELRGLVAMVIIITAPFDPKIMQLGKGNSTRASKLIIITLSTIIAVVLSLHCCIRIEVPW